MRAGRWSDDRVETLRLLWAGGASARQIADRLGGVSRSAVLAKVSRLRLGAAAAPEAATPATSPPQSAPNAPRKRGKTLLQLTNHSCRWPFGDPRRRGFHFCGAAGADLERGMPYCARHARRAYGGAALGPAAVARWR